MEGLGEKVLDRLRHVVCGLHGHDTLLHFDHGRMYLRCASCGHETPGWVLNEGPAETERPNTYRPPIVQPHYISERRIA